MRTTTHSVEEADRRHSLNRDSARRDYEPLTLFAPLSDVLKNGSFVNYELRFTWRASREGSLAEALIDFPAKLD